VNVCMTPLPAPKNRKDCRHRKSPSWRRLLITGHTSWVYPLCKAEVISLLDVPKESLSRTLLTRRVSRGRGRELINGTNFRHAVEFSRSGRTPSRPSRADRGQPTKLYSVGSAPVKRTGAPPASHLVAAHGPAAARRTWGKFDRLRPSPDLSVDMIAAPCVEQGEH
jgi:hypothetical protein